MWDISSCAIYQTCAGVGVVSPHQQNLLKLIKKHEPVYVQSSGVLTKPWPRLMLDGTIWANLLALLALERKGLIELDETNHKWSSL